MAFDAAVYFGLPHGRLHFFATEDKRQCIIWQALMYETSFTTIATNIWINLKHWYKMDQS